MFVLLSALVFFAWGEIYSLFPATCADTFGAKFASANAGLLYTAKGTAALLVPLTSVIAASGWRMADGIPRGERVELHRRGDGAVRPQAASRAHASRDAPRWRPRRSSSMRRA